MNLYGFLGNDASGRVDTFGLYVTPAGFAYVPPYNYTTPYTTYVDETGLRVVKINKCNIVVFYGHGVGNWEELTTPEKKNRADLPWVVQNAACSAASVYGCYVGNYVQVQTPIPGAEQPTGSVPVNSGIDALWQRAREQARAICKSKDGCCDWVVITFENREPWLLRTGAFFFTPTRREVVHCNWIE